jgi:hypothetical protein
VTDENCAAMSLFSIYVVVSLVFFSFSIIKSVPMSHRVVGTDQTPCAPRSTFQTTK